VRSGDALDAVAADITALIMEGIQLHGAQRRAHWMLSPPTSQH